MLEEPETLWWPSEMAQPSTLARETDAAGLARGGGIQDWWSEDKGRAKAGRHNCGRRSRGLAGVGKGTSRGPIRG